MTELLRDDATVRAAASGWPAAVHTGSGWRRVTEVVARWRVETDWWRTPARRDYVRCLLDDGDCVELYLDLVAGSWHWARRCD